MHKFGNLKIGWIVLNNFIILDSISTAYQNLVLPLSTSHNVQSFCDLIFKDITVVFDMEISINIIYIPVIEALKNDKNTTNQNDLIFFLSF